MKKNTPAHTAMTLVEILLAIAIIVVTAVAILNAYITSLYLSETNKEETMALSQLTNIAEAIKATPFNTITIDFPDGVPHGTLANDYAALTGGYTLTNESITVSYSNPSGDPLEITIRLSWQDKRGQSRTKFLVTKRTS